MLGFKKKKKEENAEDKEDAGAEAEKEAKNTEGAEGAEGEGAEGGEGAQPAKKSKKKLIIILVLALVMLGGVGAGAYFFLMKGEGHDAEQAAAKQGEKRVYSEPMDFTVNLNSGGKQVSFIKATIVLELESPQDKLMIEANLVHIYDVMNTYMRELRASDLAGSAGIQRLREELLLRTNEVLAPGKVRNVLFKQIVVQ